MRRWFAAEIGRAPTLYALLLLVAVSFLAYANSLDAGFHYDDAHHIVANPYLRDAKYVPQFFHRPDMFSAMQGHVMYRPLLLVTLAWNYQWGGYDPLHWRLTSIALHALCTGGVFLTFRLLSAQLQPRRERAANAGGLVAALCFSLHPVFAETVDYASARSSLLAGCLLVWATYCHRRACTAARGLPRLGFWSASLALFAGALLSKEIAVVFPALLFWAAVLEKRHRAAVLPSLLVLALYLVVRRLVLGTAVLDFAARQVGLAAADPGSGGARPILWNLATQVRVVAAYVGMILLPGDLCADRFVRVSRGFLEPAVLFGASVILGLLTLAWRARRSHPLVSLGIVWFFVSLAPTSSIIPLNVVMNEHRLYLPGIGAMFALAGAVQPLWRSRAGALVPIGAALCVLLALLTLRRNEDWRDSQRLWESAVRVSPQSAGAWNSLGVERGARGDFEGAAGAYAKALALDPDSWNASFNLGTLHLQRGRETGDYALLERAEEWLELSLKLRPDSTRSQWFLAETWWAMGRRENAKSAFERLAGLSPLLFEMSRYPLARMALERGDSETAARLYDEALRSARDPVSALLGLARVSLVAGREDLARQQVDAAMAARPHDPEPHLFLARLRPGTSEAARHLFEAERRGYRATEADRAELLFRRKA
ncbi:MAG: tetratricopeptide repeat protein [Planctomycetaceae bacterium]